MTRQALIIANPGTPGTENYCRGVEKDVSSYILFLRSPIGGLWQEKEITVLYQPKKRHARAEIIDLGSVDYSLTIFCGHGHHSPVTDSAIIEMSPGVPFDADELRAGAGKHTLILDCCRFVASPSIIVLDEIAKAAKVMSKIHPARCRRLYDAEINTCPTGIVVLFACSIGETAGDSASQGGYYSHSLMNSADIWSRETYVDTSTNYRRLSVAAIHERAIAKVRTISRGRQMPQIEKPRSGRYFPFCIIA